MNDLIKSILPTIATALGGPLAGIAVSILGPKLGMDNAKVEDVKAVLAGMPIEGLRELTLAEDQLQFKLQQLGYDSIAKIEDCNIRAIEAVNKTMQAEAAAEHWPTYSWRPYNGFLFGTTIFGCYVVLPLCGVPVPAIPESVWLAWGTILGVASYFRGRMQADPNIPTTNKG